MVRICLSNATNYLLSSPWSNTSYGPDGPWQAVSISIGTPPQNTDHLPKRSWSANILSTSVCSNTSDCPSLNAGLFNRLASTSSTQIIDTGIIVDATFSYQAGLLPILSGDAHVGVDTLNNFQWSQ
ncbi:hypothetical protein OCU04_002632 [Sclerotinia nivalis]|uniref:Peptidase A1 domain-containing protein n=1 Tax=Sclerotinia nivalis TaxID=352851 RepID=A0A9X0AU14_9HELO|nr:hypothetical protein OCU04_002632 [Sclerotinia nivalis]